MPDMIDPGQVAQNIQGAFGLGQQQAEQIATRNALGAYAQNMNPQTAANVVRYNPQIGMELMQRQQQQRQLDQQQQERLLTGMALNGDAQARKALAYYNSDLYMKLDDQQKKHVDQAMNAIAQDAFAILQLPEEKRGEALQTAIASLNAQGVDTSGFKLSGDPTLDLKTALAMTGHLGEYEKSQQPSYTAIPEGGTLVNTRDPAAVNQFQSDGNIPQVSTPEDARKLPPGSRFMLPDGRIGTVPGGGGGNATGGFRNIASYYGQQ